MPIEDILIGLDIGGSRVRAGLATGRHLVALEGVDWPSRLSGIEEVNFVADLALEVIRKASPGRPVSAAGASLAAILNRQGEVVQWPNRPSWRGLDVRSLLELRLKMPVAIEDDANSAALAEWAYGSGQGYENLLVMMAGTGIGAGLILNGRLFRGTRGWAGELGHLTMLTDGPECSCGKRGCLQALASGRALDRLAAEHGLNEGADLTLAASRGESWATNALRDCARWLGLAAANVVNLLDLDAVVVGGGLSSIGPSWWTTLESTLRANVLNLSERNPAVLRTALSDKAGVLGAVTLARQSMSRGEPRFGKQI